MNDDEMKFPRKLVQFAKPHNMGQKIRVLQWNVLADGLAQNGDFVKINQPELLSWDKRKNLVIQELKRFDPDLICLQEVNHFDDFLKPELQLQGYEGSFQAKPKSVAESYGFKSDGIAIFFKSSRFKSVVCQGDCYTNRDSKEVQNQVWMFVDLIDKLSQTQIRLVTTHLKAKLGEENDYQRLLQVQQLLDILQNRGKNDKQAVILTGDFNCGLETQACKYVESNSNLMKIWDESAAVSAMPFTTWKIRSKGEIQHTIDYIWYDPKVLNFSGLFSIPQASEIGEDALPNSTYPSDHISVVVDLNYLS
eukprot:TRINITY_DN8994_c0_g1_i3.p1 TRINITY_DN8994_c0_g1~~TRINITY_DN8994_c0_g1_i3.p1  ORF type:complete len:307 (-),score=40.56 TRINITY_DN8994_c0_g1_i3:418-1338(-)